MTEKAMYSENPSYVFFSIDEGRLSIDVEPPADYDLDDIYPSSLEVSTSSWKRPVNLSRKSSNASAISRFSRYFSILMFV